MPSRRSHQNSHHGCLSCKARKVKCGEERPECNRCKKQGRKCEYASFGPQAAWTQPAGPHNALPPPPSTPTFTVNPAPHLPVVPPDPSSTASVSARSPSSMASPATGGEPSPGMKISNILNESPCNPAPHAGLSDAHRQDLKLMHHWTLQSYETLVDRPNMRVVWQEVVPNLAVDHSFLMHGVLSLTAFHLAYLSPEQRPFRVEQALHHHTQMISLVQPELQNISHQNCHALFAFTTLAAVVAWAKTYVTKLPGAPLQTAPTDPLDDMMELVFLLRGTSAVVAASYGWIAAGPLKHMLRGHECSTPISISADLEQCLDKLAARNEAVDPDRHPAQRLSCADAIEKLRKYFRDPEIARGEKGKLVAWPIMCDKEFIQAMAERVPIALAIAAYWGAMVQDLDMWWAESWGQQVIRSVEISLGPGWEDCLKWAKQKVGVAEVDVKMEE